MYMLALRTQWRAGTASTCRTQPFVRFSYHATERVHRGRFLPRRSSRAPARLTQQYQSFPPARRVIQGRQLVGRQLHQGFQIRDEVREWGRAKQGATSGILLRMLSARSVLQTMVNDSGSWCMPGAHDGWSEEARGGLGAERHDHLSVAASDSARVDTAAAVHGSGVVVSGDVCSDAG